MLVSTRNQRITNQKTIETMRNIDMEIYIDICMYVCMYVCLCLFMYVFLYLFQFGFGGPTRPSVN